MAMNSGTTKPGGTGAGIELETRVTVIEKTMVTTEAFQRELAAFRDEMRLAVGGLQEQISRFRDEMQAGFGELRKEMHAGFSDLRKEDAALRLEIAKTPFETFKWLLAAAGLVAAVATAIYNIWFR